MTPYLDAGTLIFLGSTVIFPFALLLLMLPLFGYIDRQRAINKAISSEINKNETIFVFNKNYFKKSFRNRWIYYGSTELSFCILAIGLLITVATSSPSHSPYLYNYTMADRHALEIVFLSLSILYIAGLFFLLVNLYKKSNVRQFSQEVIRAMVGAATFIAPASFYICFRMEYATL